VTTLAPAGLLGPETARAIRVGLSTRPLRLPFECLYDEVGSALFDAITLLPEYGVSRAERRLLDRHREVIAEWLPHHLEVVELGSGTGRTTHRLLEGLARRGPVLYHPVDISPSALAECQRQMEGIRGLTVQPFEGTHQEGLGAVVARRQPGSTLLVLFLGSNIGNFEPPRARGFLSDVRSRLQTGDGLLLGADLVKPEPVLLAAYDDSVGVTAAFNRNALARVNRELEADFDIKAFAHRAVYDKEARRVEMHLVTEETQHVRVAVLGLDLWLAPGETIWTESSYKFLPDELPRMGGASGFASAVEWIDALWPFSLSLLVARHEIDH
jgi:dimethylhistidine N-methyltransferase